jgi:hypothetical protein
MRASTGNMTFIARMTNILKPYMFVAIANCDKIEFGLLRNLVHVDKCDGVFVYLTCRGRLNIKIESSRITVDDVPDKNIGSISIKMRFKESQTDFVNLSLRIFKNGTVKISGGFSKLNSGDSQLQNFLKELCNSLIEYLGDVKELKIVLINFNFALTNKRKNFEDICTHLGKNCRIVKPDYNFSKTSGRRDIYKFYPRDDKFQIISTKSFSGQILASKSFAEAHELFSIFKTASVEEGDISSFSSKD